jgi:hypothetical protein
LDVVVRGGSAETPWLCVGIHRSTDNTAKCGPKDVGPNTLRQRYANASVE